MVCHLYVVLGLSALKTQKIFMHDSRMLHASYHGLGICLSVCSSVHLSQCSIVSKRCKLGS